MVVLPGNHRVLLGEAFQPEQMQVEIVGSVVNVLFGLIVVYVVSVRLQHPCPEVVMLIVVSDLDQRSRWTVPQKVLVWM